jgi:hypothetical protein
MLISEVEGKRLSSPSIVVVPFSWRVPCLPFYRVSEGRGVPKTLRRCLRGEESVGAVDVALATCSGDGRPSPGRRGDS